MWSWRRAVGGGMSKSPLMSWYRSMPDVWAILSLSPSREPLVPLSLPGGALSTPAGSGGRRTDDTGELSMLCEEGMGP